jgi:hypothetical protein
MKPKYLVGYKMNPYHDKMYNSLDRYSVIIKTPNFGRTLFKKIMSQFVPSEEKKVKEYV